MYIVKTSLSRIAVVVAASIAIVLQLGCHQDPNIRKQKYLESGIRYEKSGKFQEAAIQLSNSLKVDPKFSTAHYEMAKTYIKMGNLMAGYQELLRTVDLDPTNIQARLDLGSMLLAGGATDRAADQVAAVMSLNPNYADAFALRSGTEAKNGNRAAALVDVEHAIQLNPNKASYHTTLALIESSIPTTGGQQAEGELHRAIELDPTDASPHTVLAILFEKRGDLQGAEQQYQQAVKAAPKSLQARTALAGLYQRSGNQAMAEQTLRQAAVDLSDGYEAPGILFDYYEQSGQGAHAESVFAEMAGKNPKSVPLQVQLAKSYLEQNDVAKAQFIVDELNKSHSQSAPVEALDALLLVHEQKIDEAFSKLQKSVRNSPDNVQLQILLAQVALQKGDISTAESSFKEANRLDPSNIQAESGLAQIASTRSDASLLAQVANSTIAAHPDYAPAYLWRGAAEASQSQLDLAEADFQIALKKDPNSALALTQLAQLRLRNTSLLRLSLCWIKHLRKIQTPFKR